MSLRLMSIREVGNVTIVDLSGRLVFGEETMALRETVTKTLEQGKKNILLNMEDVSFIDSTGVGQLISCYVTAKNRTANLKLLYGPKKIVRDVLHMTQLDTILPSFNDEKTAVSSFSH